MDRLHSFFPQPHTLSPHILTPSLTRVWGHPLRQDEVLEGDGMDRLSPDPVIADCSDVVLGGQGLENGDGEGQLLVTFHGHALGQRPQLLRGCGEETPNGRSEGRKGTKTSTATLPVRMVHAILSIRLVHADLTVKCCPHTHPPFTLVMVKLHNGRRCCSQPLPYVRHTAVPQTTRRSHYDRQAVTGSPRSGRCARSQSPPQ